MLWVDCTYTISCSVANTYPLPFQEAGQIYSCLSHCFYHDFPRDGSTSGDIAGYIQKKHIFTTILAHSIRRRTFLAQIDCLYKRYLGASTSQPATLGLPTSTRNIDMPLNAREMDMRGTAAVRKEEAELTEHLLFALFEITKSGPLALPLARSLILRERQGSKMRCAHMVEGPHVMSRPMRLHPPTHNAREHLRFAVPQQECTPAVCSPWPSRCEVRTQVGDCMPRRCPCDLLRRCTHAPLPRACPVRPTTL